MPRPHKRVSREELRELFNQGRYWERAQEGEFVEDVEQSDEMRPSLRKKLEMPHGSVSQTVAYRLPDRTKLALVHQYVRPNGVIRGKPDPKYLLIDGVVHIPFPKP
jgi:hypothetical protein